METRDDPTEIVVEYGIDSSGGCWVMTDDGKRVRHYMEPARCQKRR